MICRAIPYEGTEPYIFASYCHADKEALFPLFEQIVLSGYRMWYDDGNYGGDDWLDSIENHLEESSVCLAFISGNSSLSHNCKSEIIYALKCNKKIIPILIDGAELPKGLRMLLSHLHYLNRSDFSSDQSLLSKICESEECQECKAPNGTLVLRNPADTRQEEILAYNTPADFGNNLQRVNIQQTGTSGNSLQAASSEEQISKAAQDTGTQRITTSISQPALGNISTSKESCKANSVTGSISKPANCEAPEISHILTDGHKADICTGSGSSNYTASESSQAADPIANKPTIGQNSSQTEKLPDASDPDATIVAPQVSLAVLFHPTANRGYILRKPQTKLGRSPIKCDIVIDGNASISKHHADIIQVNHKVFLRDANSTNGTYIHSKKIGSNSQVELDNPAVFQLYDETLVLVSGIEAWRVWENRTAVFLINEYCTAVRFMESDILCLDRNHKWPDGTLSDKKIHRAVHATLRKKSDGIYLVDESPEAGNGTFLNNNQLLRGEERLLSSGDKIRLGDTTLFFTSITI